MVQDVNITTPPVGAPVRNVILHTPNYNNKYNNT